MDLELYYYEQCPYCQRVLGALADLDIHPAMKNILEEPAFRQELQTLTGRTTVPMLKIDGQPMFESADIIAWLGANRDQINAS